MKKTLLLADEAASLEYAKRFAGTLSAPLVVYLTGELGAGKTFFTRGVLRGLGYQGAVKSPTYTLVESYQLALGDIHHFDLYRIADAEELDYIGLDHYFTGHSIVFIEWPSRGAGVLPEADILLEFHHLERGRELIVSAISERGRDILQKSV